MSVCKVLLSVILYIFNVDPKCGTCAPKKAPPFDLKKKRESLWGCVRKNICQIKHVQLNFIYVAPNNSKATCRATPCGGGYSFTVYSLCALYLTDKMCVNVRVNE